MSETHDFGDLLRFLRDDRCKINLAANCLIAVSPKKAASLGYFDPNAPEEPDVSTRDDHHETGGGD